MLSQKTVKAISSLLGSYSGCSCQIGPRLVKLIGDCGDKCSEVEVSGEDVLVRSGGTWSWHGKFCSCQSCQSR